MAKEKLARTPSPSDLTDAPWTIRAPLIPAAHTPHGGRPREVDLRAVVKTLLSSTRSGCPWEMLPHAWLPKSTVYDDLARWRDEGTGATRRDAWREQTRRQAGRESTPSAAGLDSHSVKTTARGGPERGSDGGKQVKGRKRQLVVDTLGLWSVVLIPSAGREAGVAAPPLRQRLAPTDCPRLATSFAAHTDHQHALHTGLSEHRPTWRMEVKTRPEGVKGVTPVEKRGVVERTHAWQGRSRRPSQAYERQPESSAAMIYWSTMHVMLRRLTSHGRPAFHDRSVTADALKWAS